MFWFKGKPYPKGLANAYGEGTQARAAGYPKCENPYVYGTAEHDRWNNGWERFP